MARVLQSALQVGIELCGHCDLRCRHCLREDLSTRVEFDLDLFKSLVPQLEAIGRPHIALTGGEPTLHRQLFEFLDLLAKHGFTFHFVTNGHSYPRIRQRLQATRQALTGISLSLDGATAAVHDRIRGQGSFRRTLLAIALAVYDGWSVAVQMVINRWNHHELRDLAELCSRLGVTQVVFAHTLPVERPTHHQLLVGPAEARQLDAEIRELSRTSAVPVTVSSGHYDPSLIAHCRTLKHQSYSIDCHGRLTFCCQLSGVGADAESRDVVADLRDVPLLDAMQRQIDLTHELTRERLRWVVENPNEPYRAFHCYYCLKRFGKLAELERAAQHPSDRDETNQVDAIG